MIEEKIINTIRDIDGATFEKDADLTSCTTMRLISSGDLLIVKSTTALKRSLQVLSENGIKYRLIGWGANQVVPDVKDWVYIKLDFDSAENTLNSYQQEYKLSASTSLASLTKAAIHFSLKGWEVFTGIPASLGGAIYMNAGTNLGEIGSLVKEVCIVNKKGEERVVFGEQLDFRYRGNNFIEEGDVIVSAVITHFGRDDSIPQKIKDYLSYRRSTQPLGTKNCGCVFKNYSDELRAGKVIDSLGLKGLKVGGLQVSSKHCNFIENDGSGTFEDFMKLTNMINSIVKDNYGIEFELEVRF